MAAATKKQYYSQTPDMFDASASNRTQSLNVEQMKSWIKAESGIFSPIFVLPKDPSTGLYPVRVGFTRTLAAQELLSEGEVFEVPYIIIDAESAKSEFKLKRLQFNENMARTALTPAETAKEVAELIDLAKVEIEEIKSIENSSKKHQEAVKFVSESIGQTTSAVNAYIRSLAFSQILQDAIAGASDVTMGLFQADELNSTVNSLNRKGASVTLDQFFEDCKNNALQRGSGKITSLDIDAIRSKYTPKKAEPSKPVEAPKPVVTSPILQEAVAVGSIDEDVAALIEVASDEADITPEEFIPLVQTQAQLEDGSSAPIAASDVAKATGKAKEIKKAKETDPQEALDKITTLQKVLPAYEWSDFDPEDQLKILGFVLKQIGGNLLTLLKDPKGLLGDLMIELEEIERDKIPADQIGMTSITLEKVFNFIESLPTIETKAQESKHKAEKEAKKPKKG